MAKKYRELITNYKSYYLNSYTNYRNQTRNSEEKYMMEDQKEKLNRLIELWDEVLKVYQIPEGLSEDE